MLQLKKDAFMRIKIKDNETIEEFADWFYYDAQILMGCSALLTYNNKIALKCALVPYPTLIISLVQPLVNKCTFPDMNKILKHTGIQCGVSHPLNQSSYTEYSKSTNSHSVPKGLILLKNLNKTMIIEVKITLL